MRAKHWLLGLLMVPALASMARADGEKKDEASDSAKAPAKVEIGQPAPGFELTGCDEKKYKLSDYKDKIVVLEWISKDCPVCKEYCETFKGQAAKYAEKGVVWLAIDSTHFHKAADNVEYVKAHKLPYPILSDFEGKIGHTYKASNTPHMFIINKGTLAYMGAPAKRDGSGNYVEQGLDALLAGKPISVTSTKPFG